METCQDSTHLTTAKKVRLLWVFLKFYLKKNSISKTPIKIQAKRPSKTSTVSGSTFESRTKASKTYKNYCRRIPRICRWPPRRVIHRRLRPSLPARRRNNNSNSRLRQPPQKSFTWRILKIKVFRCKRCFESGFRSFCVRHFEQKYRKFDKSLKKILPCKFKHFLTQIYLFIPRSLKNSFEYFLNICLGSVLLFMDPLQQVPITI